ncbi:MAG: DUF2892 domain-containing protein [Candidatus Falkowbacteria bacterium]
MNMKPNVGTTDRIIRIIIGLAIIGWGVYAKNWLGVIGLIVLVTGVIGWCGLYTILGLNTTCKCGPDCKCKPEGEKPNTTPPTPTSTPTTPTV